MDYFVLILEGRVQVQVGRENIMFETGPFCYFGSQCLTDVEPRKINLVLVQYLINHKVVIILLIT